MAVSYAFKQELCLRKRDCAVCQARVDGVDGNVLLLLVELTRLIHLIRLITIHPFDYDIVGLEAAEGRPFHRVHTFQSVHRTVQ